jgi:hypothetical protein
VLVAEGPGHRRDNEWHLRGNQGAPGCLR